MAAKAKRADSLRETWPGLRHVLAALSPYLKGQGGLITGGAAAMVAAVLAKLAEPWPLKFVIDHVVSVDGQTGSGIAMVDALDPKTLLVVAALGLVFAIGLRA